MFDRVLIKLFLAASESSLSRNKLLKSYEKKWRGVGSLSWVGLEPGTSRSSARRANHCAIETGRPRLNEHANRISYYARQTDLVCENHKTSNTTELTRLVNAPSKNWKPKYRQWADSDKNESAAKCPPNAQTLYQEHEHFHFVTKPKAFEAWSVSYNYIYKYMYYIYIYIYIYYKIFIFNIYIYNIYLYICVYIYTYNYLLSKYQTSLCC